MARRFAKPFPPNHFRTPWAFPTSCHRTTPSFSADSELFCPGRENDNSQALPSQSLPHSSKMWIYRKSRLFSNFHTLCQKQGGVPLGTPTSRLALLRMLVMPRAVEVPAFPFRTFLPLNFTRKPNLLRPLRTVSVTTGGGGLHHRWADRPIRFVAAADDDQKKTQFDRGETEPLPWMLLFRRGRRRSVLRQKRGRAEAMPLHSEKSEAR